jgi:uncharacterized membrane protein
MLDFVKSVFRGFFEVILWINLILCIICGGIIGNLGGGHPILGVIILIIIACSIFSLGVIFGYNFIDNNRDIQNRQQGHRDIALYIYQEIETKFGSIKPPDDYKNIID